VKEIFGLDRCWIRGKKSNRWIFAAMDLTVQMHQRIPFKENRLTWCNELSLQQAAGYHVGS
jgi:hypothetical protein